MTPPFETRLRDQLVGGLPAHRERRRRRDRALTGLAVVALVAVVGAGAALAGTRDDGATERTDTRPITPTSEAPAAPTTTAPPSSEPIVVPPGGPALDPAVADEAADVVRELLADLRAGDVEGATEHYIGYLGFGDPRAELQDLIDRDGDLLADPDPEILVTPSPGFTDAYPVVTVVSRAGPMPRASAFVVDGGPQEGRTGLLVERLPTAGETDPQAGAAVRPDDRVTVADTPVEGGARAFVGTEEISVVVDHVSGTTSVVLPEGISGEVVLTVSFATPELPSATAVLLAVAST